VKTSHAKIMTSTTSAPMLTISAAVVLSMRSRLFQDLQLHFLGSVHFQRQEPFIAEDQVSIGGTSCPE